MRTYLLTLLVALSVLVAGCDILKQVKRVEDIAIELRIYSRNLGTANNQAFKDGVIAPHVHINVAHAIEMYSITLDRVDGTIRSTKAIADAYAKASGEAKKELKGKVRAALSFTNTLITVEASRAVMDIVDAVFEMPPHIKEKMESIIFAIKAALLALKGLFAELMIEAVKPEELRYAE